MPLGAKDCAQERPTQVLTSFPGALAPQRGANIPWGFPPPKTRRTKAQSASDFPSMLPDKASDARPELAPPLQLCLTGIKTLSQHPDE